MMEQPQSNRLGKNNIEGEISRNTMHETEIDLLDLAQFFLGRIKLIIAAFVIGAVVAGSVTFFLIKPTYTATARMYMVSSSSGSVVDLSDINIGESLSQDYAELVATRPIIQEMEEQLGLKYSYSKMLDMITLSAVADTRILKIEVTSTDPKEARDIANTLAEVAKKELPKIMEAPAPHIAEHAITPKVKSAPSLTKNTLIGALLAMLLVMGYLTCQYLMDDTIRTPEDMKNFFGVMPLTSVPEGDNKDLHVSDRDAPVNRSLLKRVFGKRR